MALATPAQPTGFSGFWQYMAPAGQTGQYNFRFYRSSEEYRSGVQMGKRGYRKYRAQLRALNGVAPGATATDTYPRVTAVQAFTDGQSGGGKRTVGTVSNTTTTTAAMVTRANALLYDQNFTYFTGYPRELSGNGGGGKVGR
jgi:hypothetical protein